MLELRVLHLKRKHTHTHRDTGIRHTRRRHNYQAVHIRLHSPGLCINSQIVSHHSQFSLLLFHHIVFCHAEPTLVTIKAAIRFKSTVNNVPSPFKPTSGGREIPFTPIFTVNASHSIPQSSVDMLISTAPH